MLYKFLLISIISVTFISCEKTITFNIEDAEPKLVIEGTIENNQPPIIYLSKSLGYFSEINPSVLESNFVHNADVFVSNGTLTHKLKEYATQVGGYTAYYYSIDSTNLATAFIGQLNSSYSLKIIWNNKEYTATTIIPLITRQIDSVYWKPAPPGNPVGKVSLMLKATDPPGLGDYIRYFTKQNNDPFYPGLNSVYDDQIIDGSTYEIQVERGIPRIGSTPESYSYFERGDTITLKLCNIDKATYDFWRTMEFTYASVGNPFSTPTKVDSNISNGGLGYFGGYAAQYRTVIVPQ